MTFDRKEWLKANLDKFALASRRYHEKMKEDPLYIAKKRAYTQAARARLREEKALLPKPLPIILPVELQPEKKSGRPRKY